MATSNKLRKIYDLVFTIYTILFGVFFIYQIGEIYFGGKKSGLSNVYTRDIVAKHLSILLPFAIAWVILIIAGLIIYKLSTENIKKTAYNEPVYIFNRYKKRMPSLTQAVEAGKYNDYTTVKDAEFSVKAYKTASVIIWLAVAVYGIVYLFIPSNFTVPANATKEIVRLIAYVFPFVGVAFAGSIAVTFIEKYYASYTLPLLKNLTAGRKPIKKATFLSKLTANKKFILGVRVAVVTLGVVFVVLGVALKDSEGNNGVYYVIQKAINICTECIGLG